MDFYKFNLNTYKYPPIETCTIEELEEICGERLQLYRIMNGANNLELEPNTKKWEEHVECKVIENKLKTCTVLLKNETLCVGLRTARRHNHIAHWLLSLCYCRTEYLREFFMCCELYWFVMLYKRMTKKDLREFLMENGFNCMLLDYEEKELLADKLLPCGNINENTFNNVTYYKTNFYDVVSLVKMREVFLYRGFAYFPEAYIIFYVKDRLWKQFNQQLAWTNQMLPTTINEERIQEFLTNIPLVKPHCKYTDHIIQINLDNIDEIADMHFPLCMKTIHNVLRRDHHLKYDCKMQYGVFLKCLGLSYDDAMEFWKQEFTKKMSLDWFDRKYSYLFKHQYGRVGGMLDYKPYSCEKILEHCPDTNQHHGCPFKHWDPEKLLKKCQTDWLHHEDINKINDLVISNKFKEACTVYFCGTRKIIRTEVIQSPNEYCKQSYEIERNLEEYFGSV